MSFDFCKWNSAKKVLEGNLNSPQATMLVIKIKTLNVLHMHKTAQISGLYSDFLHRDRLLFSAKSSIASQ